MIIYLLIGMLLTFMLESVLIQTGETFTMGERLITVLIWPLTLFALIYYIFK